MTTEPTNAGATPMLVGVQPQLFVGDIQAACRFYVGRLGFSVSFVYGEPPFYGQVVRDSVRLNLRHVDRPVLDPAEAHKHDLLSATIIVHDVDRLFAEFESRGANFHQALRDEEWGARTFIVVDPDGNLVLFADNAGA